MSESYVEVREDGAVRLAGTLAYPEATVADVLTVQADGSIAAAAGGGSSSSVKLASASLTSPQILDLANTPVTVLPAPGAGKANIVTFVTGAYHYGTTPYTGSGTIGVAPNIRNNAYNLTESSLLTVAFSAIATFDASLFYTGGAIEYDHTDLVNQPWKAKVDQENTPLADGDGTLTIYCTYFTVDA